MSEAVPEGIEHLFENVDKARRYVDILGGRGIEWGLLGPRETDRLWERHVLNSAALASLISPGVHLTVPVPRGAFYAYPSIEGLVGRTLRGTTIDSSATLAALILEHAEVAIVPGEAFGPSGFVRLSYALGDDDLVEGVGRVQKLLAEVE